MYDVVCLFTPFLRNLINRTTDAATKEAMQTLLGMGIQGAQGAEDAQDAQCTQGD